MSKGSKRLLFLSSNTKGWSFVGKALEGNWQMLFLVFFAKLVQSITLCSLSLTDNNISTFLMLSTNHHGKDLTNLFYKLTERVSRRSLLITRVLLLNLNLIKWWSFGRLTFMMMSKESHLLSPRKYSKERNFYLFKKISKKYQTCFSYEKEFSIVSIKWAKVA